MSAFERSLRVFPVSAALLSGILASMAGSDSKSASAQESPVTGSSFSSATSVHDDKHVRNAVLQHSTSETRPLGEIQRGWTAAHGKFSLVVMLLRFMPMVFIKTASMSLTNVSFAGWGGTP